jgi:hypothetical protein
LDTPPDYWHEAGSKQLFVLVSCLAYFTSLKMEAKYFSKHQVSGMLGIITQKAERSVANAVRTSISTQLYDS